MDPCSEHSFLTLRLVQDGNGFISRDEISSVLIGLKTGEDQETIIDAMMFEADRNGDGQIDYQEFVDVLVKARANDMGLYGH